MKRFSLIFALLILAIPANAAGPFYVDSASGNDSNTGLSWAAAWKTIAKADSAKVVLAGGASTIYLGGTFREKLVAPKDSLTYRDYDGTALLVGSAPRANARWTLATMGGLDVLSKTVSNGVGDGATRNYRQVVHAASMTGVSASKITITIQAHSTGDLVVVGAGIGPRTTGANVSAMTRITWDGGNAGATISASAAKTSDAITYNLNAAQDQIITLYMTSRHIGTTGSYGDSTYYNSTAADSSQAIAMTGLSNLGTGWIKTINAVNVAVSYAYADTCASDPDAIWENGTYLTKKTTIIDVEKTAGSWFWSSDSSKVYAHSSDNSSVITNGKTYESAALTCNVYDNGKTNLVFDGIDCTRSGDDPSNNVGGYDLRGDYNVVRNCSSYNHVRHCITFYTGCTGCTGDNLQLYNAISTTPVAFYHTTASGNTLKNSTVYNNANYTDGVIVVHGGTRDNIIEDCDIGTSSTQLINLYNSGTQHIRIQRNYLHGSFTRAIMASNIDSLFVWNNVINATAATDTLIRFNGCTLSQVYNNTIYGTAAKPAIALINTATGASVKNNIFQYGGYAAVDASSQTNAAIDYNDWYGANGTPFVWGTTAYNFADWKTNSSQDAHSLNADPKLKWDYTLSAGSPAINTGCDVGMTVDYLGRRIRKLPDIGANEYQPRGRFMGEVSNEVRSKITNEIRSW